MSNPDLEYIACPTANCGGQWLPKSKVSQLRSSHVTFYCPSGHSQYFADKTELEKLRERVAELEKCPMCGESWRNQRDWHMRIIHGAYFKGARKKKAKAA